PLVMSKLFSDNMVIQQGVEVPVWGSTTPKDEVTVRFRTQNIKTKADHKGNWQLKLKPEQIGIGDSLVITTKSDTLVFRSVAVGEVWVASGQSNMEVQMINNWAPINDAEKETANANFPDIRLFTVNRNTSITPIDTLISDGWKACTPETAKDFSAVAYFFARNLQQTIKTPVGVIFSAWGGTTAESWTSAEALSMIERYKKEVKRIQSLPADTIKQREKYEKDNAAYIKKMGELDLGIKGTDSIFAKIDLDESDWDTLSIPSLWESSKIGVFDGSVWFRKTIEVKPDWVGKSMTLNVSPSDDYDEAWINGVKVGQSGLWGEPRHYAVPEGLIKKNGNVIVLRVSDFQGAGGFNGKPEDLSLSYGKEKISLSGVWKCHKGFDLSLIKEKPIKPNSQGTPTVLFNAMIHPLIPYAIKGVIWYQGEENAGKAWEYRDLFQTLITDWRKQWNQGDFPFYFVQLAAHMRRLPQPADEMWPELREAQMLALQLPNTGMAIAIDAGDAENIHPGNKQVIGKRLSLWALAKCYGESSILYSGPTFNKMDISGDTITLTFNNVGKGLRTKPNKKELKGFAVAGEDKIFHWAKAKITIDNKVILLCDEVKQPVAVRYAWASNPECNLTDSDGLPASPFRTDNWKLLTQPE
ncbi:MAG TPA: sialate O-acetylesterase, partial [Fervidobacterium sp.]|nr:sialate O-acetylesterase [Fervidobacterium sp.]